MEEFGGLDGASETPSANFLKAASKLSKTGHGYLLSNQFAKFKLSADIPLSHKDIGLDEPHPVLQISDTLKSFDRNGKTDLIFMGNSLQRYEEFWRQWQLQQPDHPIYRVHGTRLSHCVPVMVHADEGTSQKKKGLMIVQVQPALGRGTSKRKTSETKPGVNFLGKSLLTRWLYSVMLTRVYSGKKLKNKPLHKLVEHLALELKSAFYQGNEIKHNGETQTIFLVPIAMKGDWAALVKCGQLTRHHLRDVTAKEGGKGICHLCLGGQKSHAWHDISFSNMKKMRRDAPPPWASEPALVKHLPLGEPYKNLFFRIDVFHGLHKGVFGDIAANAIALGLNHGYNNFCDACTEL